MRYHQTRAESVDRRHTRTIREETDARLLQEIVGMLAVRPFRPYPLLRNGHAQTLAGWAWPRRLRYHPDEVRLFEVEPGVRLHVTDLGEVEPVVLMHGWQSIAFYTASFIILCSKHNRQA